MEPMRYDGRVAVISGAGRGLGRAYALLLASRGARVVVNDVGVDLSGVGKDSGPAHEVVDEIRAAGGEAIASTDSVATSEGGNAIIAAAAEQWGRIDILIHNAGNVRRGPLAGFAQTDFDEVLDVHLRGGFHLVRAAFPRMIAAGYGRIVMTTSIGGLYGNSDVVPYCVSKAGLIGLALNAAIEGAPHNIKSNVIVPAAVTRMAEGLDTSQYPPMAPELVAPAVAWLAHERCSVTGEMLIALAGRIARAFVTESVGVWRPDWTIEAVDEQIDRIRDQSATVTFPQGPGGFGQHLGFSFQMARDGAAR
ncbi:MAG: SDR family NAD(P)-dependent oxidoreductase [Sandarakinorhabdus sp.]|nr:SDR family NAD(P)-dependent oxidoreductase [Sandarakinorhabdus sp.]